MLKNTATPNTTYQSVIDRHGVVDVEKIESLNIILLPVRCK